MIHTLIYFRKVFFSHKITLYGSLFFVDSFCEGGCVCVCVWKISMSYLRVLESNKIQDSNSVHKIRATWWKQVSKVRGDREIKALWPSWKGLWSSTVQGLGRKSIPFRAEGMGRTPDTQYINICFKQSTFPTTKLLQ